MSKYVKISLVAPRASTNQYTEDLNSAVEWMKRFLKTNIDRVLPDKPDLIILPEACDRYPSFTMEQRKKYYQHRGDSIRDFLAEIARENNCYIAYSACRNTPWDEKYPYRNSTQIIGRDGSIVGVYDKNHLVTTELTNGGIAYGTKAELIELDFGKIACAICFDLNFEELLLKYIPQKPDLIVFSSMYHGGLVQEQWAYRCRSFFAGSICGDQSRVLNPFGETIATSTNYYSFMTTKINLDYKLVHIDYNAAKYTAAKKKYGEDLIIYDPGHVGSVMMSCERDDMTVMDIINEFEIELLDDYFERSLKHRHDNIVL